MSDLRQQALDYHAFPKPGKISVEITTSAETADDLSLAYSPGVAEPVREIAANPDDVYKYTAKGNLVAVITNGTAILGLGNLGPLASKPVMEGKALLFKRFANLDSIDFIIVRRNAIDKMDQKIQYRLHDYIQKNQQSFKAFALNVEDSPFQNREIPEVHFFEPPLVSNALVIHKRIN